MSKEPITPESCVQKIGDALAVVARELDAPHPTAEELEQGACSLVMELQSRGLTIVPKIDFDDLTQKAWVKQ